MNDINFYVRMWRYGYISSRELDYYVNKLVTQKYGVFA